MPGLPESFVDTPESFARMRQDLTHAKRIAIDTEFIGEDAYAPELCLIQVATSEALFVIDPYAVGDVAPFWRILTRPDCLTVFHAGREELRMCHRAIEAVPSHSFDVQIAAGLLGHGWPLGHGSLVSTLCHQTVSKAETLTNWRARPLRDEQIRYAFDDVRWLLRMHDLLDTGLTKHDRYGWFAEEMARFLAHSLLDSEQSEKWRKLKGISGMTRRQLASVRELFTWREELASRHNKPPRLMMRDDLLVELARRSSIREKEIASVRGISAGHVPVLVEVLRRAKDLHADLCPVQVVREAEPEQMDIILSVLSAVVQNYCVREKLSPTMAATMGDLRHLILTRMGMRTADRDCLLQTGWRRETLLPMLAELLDGRTSLSLADLESPAPLAFRSTVRPDDEMA